MFKKIFFFFLVSILAQASYAQSLTPMPELRKGRLSNGLTYYIYSNAYPKGEAVYRLFIKSGSVNEDDNQKGLAHFLEHMAFNGTKNFPENTLVEFLETKGAKFGKDLNAHTSFNETVYKLQLPTNTSGIVDTTLTILADWVNGFQLDSVQIDAERGVILSERLSKTGAQKDVNNEFLMMLLNNSRYASRITIGDTAIIKNFPHKDLKAYYQTWYRPELMAVAIVGDVDVNQVEKTIKKKFSAIPNVGKSKYKTYGIASYNNRDAKIIVNKDLKDIQLNYIQLLPQLKPVNSAANYLPYLERSFINRLIKSRFAALSFTTTSYSNPSASISDFINTKGLLLASVELHQKKVKEGIEDFSKQLEQIYQYGFTKSEIEKAKTRYGKQLERRANSKTPVQSDEIMNEIYADFYKGNIFISPAVEYKLFQQFSSKIDSVKLVTFLKNTVDRNKTHYLFTTFDSSNAFANKNQLINYITAIQKIPVSRYEKEVRIIDKLINENPTPGKIVAEKYIAELGATDMLLSNGVRVFFKPTLSSKNRINFSAFKLGGLYSLDSADYINGSFAGSVIPLSGVAELSRDELSQYLAGNSASVRFLIDKTRTGIIGGSSLQNIETLFQLLYLRSTDAKVDEAVFEQTKKVTIEAYKNENKTAETQYYKDLSNLLIKRNYTNQEMTDTVVERVALSRLLPVYNKFFKNASGYTYVINSDTSLAFIKPFILKYIASLPGNIAEQKLNYQYKGGIVNTTGGVLIKSVGSSPRAVVSLIFQETNIPKEYLNYQLQSTVAENILKMKLTEVIREKLGLVYSISVNTSSLLNPSPLSRSSISFSCQPEKVDFIIENIQEIINGIGTNKADYKKEFINVRANLNKEFELDKQRDVYWSTIIRDNISNNVGHFNNAANYLNELNKIDYADVAQTIRFNFNTKNMIKAVLLPASKK